MRDILDITYFSNNMYYTPCLGLTGTKIKTYNEYVHLCAKLFFKLLDKYNLDYYVFAGTSIGYVRNKSNIPWVDDYDIIIFDKDIQYFENNILSQLINNGFVCEEWISGKNKAGYRIFSTKITDKLNSSGNYFQCDIFYSKIDENNMVKNLAGCGLYHLKNVYYDMVYPSQRLEIDGLILPFFNKIEEDVMHEYGDVINNVCIHLNHKRTKIFKEHYSKMYEKFNAIINKANKNTINLFTKNKNYEYINNRALKNNMEFKTVFDILKYINTNNVNTLFILDEEFLKYCISIKYYFPQIKIILYIFNTIKNENKIFLNNIDIIRTPNDEIKNIYDNQDLIYINKPIFEYINVITFGTYDLFHVGHTNILKRAKEIGHKLIVGISSDDFNIKKGKISVNNLEKRIEDVLNSKSCDTYFVEESMEQKDEYIKKHNANLLVMGDDWDGKFDWVSCPCMYFPRTPEISTTLLKEKIGFLPTIKTNIVSNKQETINNMENKNSTKNNTENNIINNIINNIKNNNNKKIVNRIHFKTLRELYNKK
jgi:glycerol-3-phosphate cytidylyltransferase